MTGAKDPGIGAAKWELYQELLKEGQLTVRVFALWSGARRLEDRAAVLARVQGQPATGRPRRRRHAGVGRRQDVHGRQRRRADRVDVPATGTRTSTRSTSGNTGYPSTDPAAYRQIVTELHNAGVHVSTHAIGDRAIDWVVDTYDRALQRHTDARPSPRIHSRQHADRSRDRRRWRGCSATTTPPIRRPRPASCGGLATTMPATSDRSAICG